MAGGIDWFRWHHGTVTDQKFPLVARRAGATVAEVIAVWACLLERASMNEAERGLLGGLPDFEAMDCALGLVDGKALAIFQALQQRDLIDQHLHVTAWPVRQPKRERPDDNSTERSRRHRAMQRHATPENGDATPCNTDEHSGTPRGEERREEPPPSEPNGSSGGGAPQAAGDPPPPAAGAAATSRGSRLSEAWRLPKGWGDWALGEFPQWDATKVRREGEAFRDHWVAKTGKDATKRDWEATWRNWCRSSIAHRDDPRGGAAVTPAESAAAGSRAAAMTRQMLDAQDAVPLASPETVAAARQRLGLKPTLDPAPMEGEAA